jgi:muramoyltetrapeptide carboxypeptidase
MKSKRAPFLSSSHKVLGVMAPSGPAPLKELEFSCQRLAKLGYEILVHDQVKEIKDFYAGSDEERAQALIDLALDEEVEVILTARGGYGVVRILDYLEAFTREYGIPRSKTLVGYSDVTLLLDYVAKNWGWRVIHAPMPATQTFAKLPDAKLKRIMKLIDDDQARYHYSIKPHWLPKGFKRSSAPLMGGNLAMIASVIGTPYEMVFDGAYLFLEEVTEAPYRLDRLMQQLYQSGGLSGVKGIVLGTFTSCEDSTIDVWTRVPSSSHAKVPLKPMRKLLSQNQVIDSVFGKIARDLQIPLFKGLQVGHGNGLEPLELFKSYQISVTAQRAELVSVE